MSKSCTRFTPGGCYQDITVLAFCFYVVDNIVFNYFCFTRILKATSRGHAYIFSHYKIKVPQKRVLLLSEFCGMWRVKRGPGPRISLPSMGDQRESANRSYERVRQLSLVWRSVFVVHQSRNTDGGGVLVVYAIVHKQFSLKITTSTAKKNIWFRWIW